MERDPLIRLSLIAFLALVLAIPAAGQSPISRPPVVLRQPRYWHCRSPAARIFYHGRGPGAFRHARTSARGASALKRAFVWSTATPRSRRTTRFP